MEISSNEKHDERPVNEADLLESGRYAEPQNPQKVQSWREMKGLSLGTVTESILNDLLRGATTVCGF